MNEYDLIYEELCERVECGELTLEEAEIINDVAYDKYVKEANIYDKIIDKHADASDRYEEKLNKITKAKTQYDPHSREYKALDKIEDRTRGKKLHHAFNPSLNIDPYNKKWSSDGANSLRYMKKDDSDHYRQYGLQRYGGFDENNHKVYNHAERKKEWMKLHGNVGQTPEERYKAGRYDFN